MKTDREVLYEIFSKAFAPDYRTDVIEQSDGCAIDKYGYTNPIEFGFDADGNLQEMNW